MPEQQPTEEQIKEFQEKLAKMSPEEREAFFRQQCIFCQIIDGKIESTRIYEDEDCLAILDINPANPGHILLMPKKHLQVGPQVPQEVMERLGKVTKALSNCCLQALKCEGTSIFVANGLPAGQRAQHFMIHIVPRKSEDGLTCFDLSENKIDPAQLNTLASDLRTFISKKLGIEIKEESVEEPAVEEESQTKSVKEQQKEPTEEPIPPTPEETTPIPPTPKETTPKVPAPKEVEAEFSETKKEKGYLYFVDKEGDISRVKMVRGRKKGKQPKEKIKEVGITRKKNCLYYVDANLEIQSSPMNRGRKTKKKGKTEKKEKPKPKKEPEESQEEEPEKEKPDEEASLDDIASLFT